MKRYLLFRYPAGSAQDGEPLPRGGWYDFIGSFDTVDDCKIAAVREPFPLYDSEFTNEAQIVDTELERVLWSGSFEFDYTAQVWRWEWEEETNATD